MLLMRCAGSAYGLWLRSGWGLRRRSQLLRVLLAAAALTAASTQLSVARADAYSPPPIRHVWVIVLENSSYNKTPGLCCSPFNTPGTSPYLANVLTKQGNLLTHYWGVGHNSLSNYIAMVSGQSPTPETQADFGDEWQPSDPVVDPHGQVVGQGGIYPAKVKTLADQLSAHGLSWKGYMQDLRDETGHEGSGCPTQERNNPSPTDQYVKKHDPFQWFHSVTDDQALCLSRDVPLTELARDLQSVETTPNFNFISPGLFDDGHEGDFERRADPWLRQYVPMITSSPAYRQDGMIIVTFDESEIFLGTVPLGPEDEQACCNEIPGPNSPSPGVFGPGGGRTGALVLSPFVKPGTKDDPADNPTHSGPGFYNHYSFLRSMEDLFGIDSGGDDGLGHLGFAGSYGPEYPGPGAFGPDVYNGYDGSPASPPSQEPPATATGPRRADGSATWQHPLPAGGDLEGVSCATTTACFAVGDSGTILATTDGGVSWSLQRSGGATDLNAISCASANDCAAVGNGGTVLTSSDGGGTWSSRSSGTDAGLNGVSCPTASTCIAVGDGGTTLRSSDGGTTWASQPSGTQEPLYGVSCPTEIACFAVGGHGAALTTTNGSSWSAKSLVSGFPERLWAVSCPTASSCVAGGDAGTSWSTTDGGASWSKNFNGPGQSRGVSCASNSVCFLVGENGHAQPDDAAIMATTNGGGTWQPQATHSDNILHGVSCPSTTLCVAAGMRGTILRTTDGGSNWSSRSPGTDGDLSRIVCTSFVQCLPEGMNALQGVSCTSASTCFAVGSYRTVMATGNGGATWTTQTSGAPQNGGLAAPPVPPPGLNSVSCPVSGKCVAVGDLGSIVVTSDGGANWSNRDSGSASDLLGVSCPTAATCFAVGSNGTVLRTTNGGGSWTKQSLGVGSVLSAVSCASSSTCVAVGGFGTVLATTNGGAKWSLRGAGTGSYLDGVSCATAKVCVAVGAGGTVLRTVNAGGVWSEQSSGIGDDLRGISCSSASTCLASGSLGTVVSSADGGTSWSARGTGTSRALRAVSCPKKASACFAAGDAGAILRVTRSATG
jgi:photosystem II stability/assembly factor-like uncharacterized protein